eukprot:11922884-Ditylum_brightwellii.AAC.1
MESSYTVPPVGMEARELYKSENQYFYNVLQNCVKGGQGKKILPLFRPMNVYLALESCAGNTVLDEEKIRALNASTDDSCFSS